jgi:murein L,D-transpeptidase YcbB/YkuD
MFHPSRPDTCFAALLGLDESRAIVSVGTSPDMAVPRSQLDDYWTRDAVVLWPEAEETRSVAGARGELLSLGYAGPDLQGAVRRFQRDVELVPDGLLGPRTRMALFAASAAPRPRLSTRGERP